MLSRRLAWTVALAAAFTMTVSYVDRSTLAVLAPAITKALDISDTGYGWLTSAFSVAYLVAVPLSGWWIDRAGARRGLLVSVVVWSSVAALHAIVPGFAMLFALRIALGVAEGPSFPGAAQTMYRVLPAGDRSRGYAFLFTGSSVGSMIAPPLASMLYDAYGWRIACLGTAVIGLAWVPVWLALTGRPEVRVELDARPAPTETASPGLRALLADPLVLRGMIAVLGVAPVIGFGLAWASKYLVRAFGTPQGSVGHYLWLPPLAFDVGAILFGDLAARQRRASGAPPRALLAVGSVLAAGVALLPLMDSPWTGTAILAVSLFGAGAAYTLVTGDLLARMPPASVSFAGGLLAAAQSLALIIANPLIGGSVDRYASFDVAAVVIGAWVIPGCALWLMWRPAPGLALRRPL